MNFNEYRARYAELTDDEHRAAYAEWFRLYPSQKCCTLDALRRFLADHDEGEDKAVDVLEIGGWDGWAARAVLPGAKHIGYWDNVEICDGARVVGEEGGPLDYFVTRPTSFRWWRTFPVDDRCLVVASHVIEHLSDDDAREIVSTLKPRAWYIEAPLSEDGQDWDNYNGSHVLRAGWKQLDAWLRDAGYEQAWAMGDARSYVRAR